MEIQLIRHATMLIAVKGQRLLLDPMLSPPGTMSAIPGVKNTADNPLTPLPVELASLLNPSAILLTHTHRDHWDTVAMENLPGTTPVLCQPVDAERLNKAGFNELLPIENSRVWQGLTIYRTGGQHGTGEIGRSMGPVSGFVLTAEGEPRLYITGDTIWCSEVESTLTQYEPDIIICFAGEARFSTGDPITMGKEDIARLCLQAPQARIVAVHLEAWNHCGLTRQELNEYLQENALTGQVLVPNDGECFVF